MNKLVLEEAKIQGFRIQTHLKLKPDAGESFPESKLNFVSYLSKRYSGRQRSKSKSKFRKNLTQFNRMEHFFDKFFT
jgi:hypothetical protein